MVCAAAGSAWNAFVSVGTATVVATAATTAGMFSVVEAWRFCAVGLGMELAGAAIGLVVMVVEFFSFLLDEVVRLNSTGFVAGFFFCVRACGISWLLFLLLVVSTPLINVARRRRRRSQ